MAFDRAAYMHEYRKEYRAANREKLAAAEAAYRAANREKRAAVKAAYAKTDAGKHSGKAAALRFRLAHPEVIQLRNKAYVAKNQSRERERWREWYCAHPDSDGYIAALLNMPLKEVPPEVLAAKRMHVQIARVIKQKETQ